MSTGQTVWVRYTWDLSKLNVLDRPPVGYGFRSATREEIDIVTQVVLRAYYSDPIWRPMMSGIEKRMKGRISSTFYDKDTAFIVAENMGGIVGVSGVTKVHWTGQNLLTGVCVLPEHQRKGLGKFLLGLSLSRLRLMGLPKAAVYTELGSVADRKLYPLFGSTREEGVEYPGVHPG